VQAEMLSIVAKQAQDMRGMWQVRALEAARGKLGMVLLSVLAHSYDDAMPVLLRVAFPGYIEPALPCLVTAARISKTGAVVADVVDRDGFKHLRTPLYPNEMMLRDEFRRLADRLKLNDADRVEMFKAVQRWVVADMRLDPTMDPKDPDAKRLVH